MEIVDPTEILKLIISDYFKHMREYSLTIELPISRPQIRNGDWIIDYWVYNSQMLVIFTLPSLFINDLKHGIIFMVPLSSCFSNNTDRMTVRGFFGSPIKTKTTS